MKPFRIRGRQQVRAGEFLDQASSGNWDQVTNWSLGVLPDSSQSVFITNSGWKAVAINPSTLANFSGLHDRQQPDHSRRVGHGECAAAELLRHGGPADGVQRAHAPGRWRILNFGSGLVVQGGTMLVTNSQIIQDGGFVRTTNAQMNLSGSEYQLTNGVFEGGPCGSARRAPASSTSTAAQRPSAMLDLGTPAQGSSGAYSLYGGYLNLPGGLSLSGREQLDERRISSRAEPIKPPGDD